MARLSMRHALHPAGDRLHRLPGAIEIAYGDWRAEARRLGASVRVSVIGADPRAALEHLLRSERPMDRWFKDAVRDLTGEDLPSLFS